MSEIELFDLVSRAKNGDQIALTELLERFSPVIKKTCQRAHLQERKDLEQHMNERIIRAVYEYDMNAVPDFKEFIRSLSE